MNTVRTRTGVVIGGAYIPPRSPQYAQAGSRHTRAPLRRQAVREWFAALGIAVTAMAAGAALIVLTLG